MHCLVSGKAEESGKDSEKHHRYSVICNFSITEIVRLQRADWNIKIWFNRLMISNVLQCGERGLHELRTRGGCCEGGGEGGGGGEEEEGGGGGEISRVAAREDALHRTRVRSNDRRRRDADRHADEPHSPRGAPQVRTTTTSCSRFVQYNVLYRATSTVHSHLCIALVYCTV